MSVIMLILTAMLLISCSVVMDSPVVNDKTNGVTVAKFTNGYLKTVDFLKQEGEAFSEDEITQVLQPEDEVYVTVRLGDGITADMPDGLSVGDFIVTPEGEELVAGYRSAQEGIYDEIVASGISVVERKHSYTVLQNGFSIKVKYGDIASIEALPGVERVIISEQYAVPDVTTGEIQESFASTGIFNNSTGYSGTGTVIAVIDTGVDYTHPAFATAPTEEKITKEYVDKLLFSTNAAESYGSKITTAKVYYSAKVPFGYNYIDKNFTINPSASDCYSYGHNHGTHVAGIAAGNSDTIKGAAWDAQIAVMRVFGKGGAGAYDVDIYAAVEDCVILGVDVANLSLGAVCGVTKSANSYVSDILEKAERAGLLVLCATGNSNTAWYYSDTLDSFSTTDSPDNGVVSQPASYDGTFAVGSAQNLLRVYFKLDGENVMGRNGVASEGSASHSFLHILGDKESATFEYVIVPGVGSQEDFRSVDVKGKIAVIQRGDISFAEKIKNAGDNGAIGCILYDNVEESINQFGALVGEDAIPTMTITLSDGLKLANAENKVIEVNKAYYQIDYSYFSSMGALSDLSIGVDVIGIGGNVYSSISTLYAKTYYNNQIYAYMSGTSMATPNVAGVMASLRGYLKEKYPYLTGAQISAVAQQRIMSTANILTNEENNPYTPRRQGSGLADIYKAMQTEAYLTVTGSNKTKLNLGTDKNKDGVYTLYYNLVNDGENELSYTFDTLAFTESAVSAVSIGYTVKGNDAKVIAEKAYMFEDAEFSYYVNGQESDGTVTVKGGETVKIKVVIRLSEEDKAYMDETFENGIYVEGYSVLKSNDNDIDLHIPFISFYGDWYALPAFEPTIFDGEVPTYGNYSGLGLVYYEPVAGSVYYMGMKFNAGAYYYAVPNGYATPKASPDKVAIGMSDLEDGEKNGVVNVSYVTLYNKRTADTLYLDIIRTNTGEYLGRNTFTGIGKFCAALISRGNLTFSDGINVEDSMIANNEEFLITMTYDFDGKPTGQVLEMPVYVDLEAPTLEKAVWREVDGRTYLDLTVYDNHYFMCTGFMTYGTPESYAALANEVIPAYAEKGSSYSYTIDVTDYLANVVNNVFAVKLFDYARNTSVYEIALPGTEVNENEANTIVSAAEEGRDLYVIETIDNSVVYGDRNDPSYRLTTMSAVSAKSNTVVPAGETDPDAEEFVIEDGVLTAYNGNGGEVVVPDGVTTIGPNVFVGLESITKITLPEGVETVKAGSIYKLGNLTELVLPKSLKRIEGGIGASSITGLPKLTKMNLEDTSISYVYEGFSALSSIETLTFPQTEEPLNMQFSVLVNANLKKVTFNGDIDVLCTSISFNDSLTEIEFFGKVNDLGGSKSRMNAMTIICCKSLERMVFHEEVGEIGFTYERTMFGSKYRTYSLTLASLPSLKEVIFEKDVGTFGGMLFSDCAELSRVVLGGNVGKVGYSAFGKDPKLYSFELTEDNAYLVKDESGLVYDLDKTRIIAPHSWEYDGVAVIPETVTEFEPFQFGTPDYVPAGGAFVYRTEADYTYYYNVVSMSKGSTHTKNQVKGVVIPEHITQLPEYCFAGNANLAEINLDNITVYEQRALSRTGITSFTVGDNVNIGRELVFGCANLEEFNFNKNATYKSWGNFFASTGLREIALPDFMSTVDSYIFNNCEKLEKVTLLGEVKTVDSSAFNNTPALRELIGFEKVETINLKAFYQSGLVNVTMQNVQTIAGGAFAECANLESVDFGESLKLLKNSDEQFADCVSLKSFYIPAGLAQFTVGSVFVNCVGLEEITVNEENPYFSSIDGVLFDKNYTQLLLFPLVSEVSEFELPETVTYLGDNVFANAKLLKKVVMPSVTELGANTFTNSGVEEIVLGAGLKVIPEYTFSGTPLKQINLENVEEIGPSAFAGTQLEEVVLNSLTYIEDRAFLNNVTLKSVTLGNVAEFNFARSFFGCTAIENITLNNCETFVLENGFLMNAEKTLLYKYVGEESEVTVPEGIVKIESEAFVGNEAIESVVLPSTLKYIGDSAFYGCTSLKEVTFLSEKAPLLQCYFRKDVRYPYNQFVKELDSEKPLDITVYVSGDASYMTPIWRMYFAKILVPNAL